MNSTNFSIAFVIPYFGKFNNYFPLWLLSCKYNPTVNWIIFTDDHTSYRYPDNVKVHYTSFAETQKRFRSHFNFPININRPYDLCELKVAYGEVYSDYLMDYDFWGYCDVDLIWGDLREHLADQILNKYKKISWRGHMTLYRNEPSVNQLYKKEFKGVAVHRIAFTNQTISPCAFDERLINDIFESHHQPIYKDLVFADIKIRSFLFHLLHFPQEQAYKNQQQLFLWDKGKLLRVYIENNVIHAESFAYIHFLKRPMQVAISNYDIDAFLIVPNKFIVFDGKLDTRQIKKYSKKRCYFSYYASRLNIRFLRRKIAFRRAQKKFVQIYPDYPLSMYATQLPEPKLVILSTDL